MDADNALIIALWTGVGGGEKTTKNADERQGGLVGYSFWNLRSAVDMLFMTYGRSFSAFVNITGFFTCKCIVVT